MAKERTLQDVLDSMTPAQKDLQATIVGAAIEDQDLSGNPEIVSAYEALSDEHKFLISYIVGIALEDGLEHDSLRVGSFLSHFGVKGMRWGVTTSRPAGSSTRLSKSAKNTAVNRREARDKVKAGSATLGDAHLAALKSTGHRALNVVVGDKTYWKRSAIAAGVAVGAAGLIAAGPMVLPASLMASIGSTVAGTSGVGGYVAVQGQGLVALSTIGAQAFTSIGATGVGVGLGVAQQVNSVTNLVRGVRGNTRVNKSYAALGKAISQRQTAGTKRVNKILNRDGGLRNKDLKHDTSAVQAFLAHHAKATLS
jgi:hypothetical protein